MYPSNHFSIDNLLLKEDVQLVALTKDKDLILISNMGNVLSNNNKGAVEEDDTKDKFSPQKILDKESKKLFSKLAIIDKSENSLSSADLIYTQMEEEEEITKMETKMIMEYDEENSTCSSSTASTSNVSFLSNSSGLTEFFSDSSSSSCQKIEDLNQTLNTDLNPYEKNCARAIRFEKLIKKSEMYAESIFNITTSNNIPLMNTMANTIKTSSPQDSQDKKRKEIDTTEKEETPTRNRKRKKFDDFYIYGFEKRTKEEIEFERKLLMSLKEDKCFEEEKFGKIENSEEEIDLSIVNFNSNPFFMKFGQMRDYQLKGLNWMISLHLNGVNGILADEMGLGKTIQTIAFLGYLKHFLKKSGPFLIIAPKSTLSNWMSEFSLWVPSLRTKVLIGYQEERKVFAKEFLKIGTNSERQWDVIVSSFDIVIREKRRLKKFNWEYIIVDEAQRIKNEKCTLSEYLRELNSENRLLLTGTPLQNNLHELWALLNFLLPKIFNSSEDFDYWFNANCLVNTDTVSTLHRIIRPFLLRRLKSEVEKDIPPKVELKIYVGLTEQQKDLYRKTLLKDQILIKSDFKKGTSQARLLNILMQLRKICNHPFLLSKEEFSTQALINSSGKMIVLDKLLPKLKKEGSRILIFSQMTKILDVLEWYCLKKKFKHFRLDGTTLHDDRQDRITRFNAPNAPEWIFLISTRAGGLGINLASADVVIIYDSDWNPSVDQQAIDRSHRIGQKKQVRIFRFVTEQTVEEKIVERAEMKLHLNKIIIQNGRLIDPTNFTKPSNGQEVLNIIRHGVDKIFTKTECISNNTISTILSKSKIRSEQSTQKIEAMDEDSILSSQITPVPNTYWNDLGIYHFEGMNYKDLQKKKQAEDEKEKINSSFEVNQRLRNSTNKGDFTDEFDPISTSSGKRKKKPKKKIVQKKK